MPLGIHQFHELGTREQQVSKYPSLWVKTLETMRNIRHIAFTEYPIEKSQDASINELFYMSSGNCAFISILFQLFLIIMFDCLDT